MKCYLCKLQGKDTDAVASCIVCGMGVCIDHVVREEVDLWEGGYPFPSKKLKNKIPRMLCIPCHEAYKEGKK
ncbi:zinc finger protein [Methanococcus vannielii SB]|jgi:hypothetical protein|uniref:Zinc finger protein n=1 Tax=Methanococcus vannielii (strain ATCC 35089 / DSM 1224 / JCM 13029 / OCM 148 / SB) TaxID=406327 RepID=A6UNI7_METVS|nr:DUF2180 family protein [Methanococcus vannielii]ABR54059.1 zinc finger protein [Methanococcus vannielii SB]